MEALLVQLLAPHLPQLLHGAGESVGSVAAAAGDALDTARRVWERLRPALEHKPAATEAAEDVAKAPDDTDAQAALRLQLKKLLADDPELAADLQRLVGSNGGTTVSKRAGDVTASGPDAVAVGWQEVSGSDNTVSGGHMGERPKA